MIDITERLRKLSIAVSEQNWQEFSMRVPAEPDRDADIVIMQAAMLIESLRQQLSSRDAEVVSLTNQRDYEYVRAENAEQERDQLREELVKALAACKAKDEALESCGFDDDSTDPEMCGSYYDAELVQRALDIQPDDSALKAWLGEPVAYMNPYGGIVTKPSTGLEQATYTIPLYSPKELK